MGDHGRGAGPVRKSARDQDGVSPGAGVPFVPANGPLPIVGPPFEHVSAMERLSIQKVPLLPETFRAKFESACHLPPRAAIPDVCLRDSPFRSVRADATTSDAVTHDNILYHANTTNWSAQKPLLEPPQDTGVFLAHARRPCRSACARFRAPSSRHRDRALAVNGSALRSCDG